MPKFFTIIFFLLDNKTSLRVLDGVNFKLSLLLYWGFFYSKNIGAILNRFSENNFLVQLAGSKQGHIGACHLQICRLNRQNLTAVVENLTAVVGKLTAEVRYYLSSKNRLSYRNGHCFRSSKYVLLSFEAKSSPVLSPKVL
jgi:hypothetical protein